MTNFFYTKPFMPIFLSYVLHFNRECLHLLVEQKEDEFNGPLILIILQLYNPVIA